ncbi:hypothetical protein ASC91_03025 [Pelomonas sp. Root1237]|nr:hypothetical protein ASC91_03025 [Pelomonas sp. Root1237]
MRVAVSFGRSVALAALACVLGPLAGAQAPLVERQSRVEAAFMRNFARYVTWPSRAFADGTMPWNVCTVDENHFDASLEQTFQGRLEQGRPFTVRRAVSPEALASCHIVFVGAISSSARRAALAQLSGLPVLTVGNAPEFLSEGGVVRLLPGEHIEMSINLDQARRASLGIPAKLLEVSSEVVEHGSLRRLR